MVNEYSVKDLIMLIIRKWKIILCMGVIFGVVSLPISSISYANAVRQYEKCVEECNIETYTNVEIGISLQTKYGDTIYLTDKLEQLVGIDYFRRAWEEYNSKEEDADFLCETAVNEGTITINIIDASENLIKFLDFYEEKVQKYFYADYKDDYVLKLRVNVQDEKMANSETGELVNMAEVLLQQPDKKEDYVKISLTAVIFGVFICTALVLVIDFCSPVIKSLGELESYGKVDKNANCAPNITVYSRREWIMQRKKIQKIGCINGKKLIIGVKLYKTPVSAIKRIQEIHQNNEDIIFQVKGKK